MITVAARLSESPDIFKSCSEYMNYLVMGLAGGKKAGVEAVEAMLILAEWEPQSLAFDGEAVGCGEEDRSAWNHVGLALRIGYWLRLDRTSFRDEDEAKIAHYNRRRLAWASK